MEGERESTRCIFVTRTKTTYCVCVSVSHFTFFALSVCHCFCEHCLIRHVNNCVIELLSVDAKNYYCYYDKIVCAIRVQTRDKQSTYTHIERALNAACLLYEISKIVLCVAFC